MFNHTVEYILELARLSIKKAARLSNSYRRTILTAAPSPRAILVFLNAMSNRSPVTVAYDDGICPEMQ